MTYIFMNNKIGMMDNQILNMKISITLYANDLNTNERMLK